MCRECRESIKAEIKFLLDILCTPNVSQKTIALTNDVLEAALADLYMEDEEDNEVTYPYGVSSVNTNGNSSITVTSLDELFKTKEQ